MKHTDTHTHTHTHTMTPAPLVWCLSECEITHTLLSHSQQRVCHYPRISCGTFDRRNWGRGEVVAKCRESQIQKSVSSIRDRDRRSYWDCLPAARMSYKIIINFLHNILNWDKFKRNDTYLMLQSWFDCETSRSKLTACRGPAGDVFPANLLCSMTLFFSLINGNKTQIHIHVNISKH